MRFRLALALSVAIILIGAASWTRFNTPEFYQPSVVTVSSATHEIDDEAFLEEFLATNKIATTTPEAPEVLTNTDVVTRNLLLSYIDLTQREDVIEEESLKTLADQYADGIAKFHKFQNAGIQNIAVVADSNTSAANYATSFSQVYATHAERIQTVSDSVLATDNVESSYIPFAKSAVTIYEAMANAFKVLPVPASLSVLHLEIVNIHLSNAAAMKSMSTLQEDPVTAIAGLATIKENSIKEATILGDMAKILKDKWGII